MTASPEWLNCWKCGKRGIRAPEGATAATRYICPSCSPVGAVLEAFDRYAFDDAADPRQFGRDAILALDSRMVDVLGRTSTRVLRARQQGKAWALAATPAAVMALSPRQRQCLTLIEWCEISRTQAAELLGIGQGAVRTGLREAKRYLSANTQKKAKVTRL